MFSQKLPLIVNIDIGMINRSYKKNFDKWNSH